eukprot:scaffold2576_cov175-Amphora_coffeaeformis.AAC.7
MSCGAAMKHGSPLGPRSPGLSQRLNLNGYFPYNDTNSGRNLTSVSFVAVSAACDVLLLFLLGGRVASCCCSCSCCWALDGDEVIMRRSKASRLERTPFKFKQGYRQY